MTFDLGKALLRKEEYESARLTEFEFAEMVRAMKALAAELPCQLSRCSGCLQNAGSAKRSVTLHNWPGAISRPTTCAAGRMRGQS